MCVLICWGGQSKIPQAGWLKPQTYFLTILGVRSPRSRCAQGGFHSEASLGLTDGRLLAGSSLAWSSLDVHTCASLDSL